MRWLFPGREIRIDAICLDCGEPLSLRFRDDEILELDPPGAVAHTVTSFVGSGEYTSAYRWSRMNIFRSEEHVKNWSDYEPESEDAIMPVAAWAKAFGGPLFRNRLQGDYLSHIREYAPAFQQALTDLGKTGPFWVRRR